jgi:hypothetical protein
MKKLAVGDPARHRVEKVCFCALNDPRLAALRYTGVHLECANLDDVLR